MATKQQQHPATDPTDVVTAANAALADRARLEALWPTLSAALKTAIAHRNVVEQEMKATALEVVLSGDPPAPDLMTAAADARRAYDLAGMPSSGLSTQLRACRLACARRTTR